MSAKVSIIVPVYNGIPYLKECLGSAASQTYHDIEVIVINDGSTDDSKKIINEFTAADTRFKLFTQENHGLGYTRNRGISLSKGEFVFFLDADDKIPKNAIQLLVEAIEKSQADFAAGKVVRFNKSRKYIPPRHLEFALYKTSKTTNIRQSPELIQDSIACNKMWRKKFVIKHGLTFKENKYYEDLGFTLRAAVLAEKIEVLKDMVYQWRVREDENLPSITQQQMTLLNTSDRLEALQENRDWLIQYQDDKNIRDQHDLKSLYDVIRLHVSKYSLVKVDEREQWKKVIVDYLKQIPKNIAEQLPEQEFTLYSLLMDNEEKELHLFSEMLTHTEKTPLVKQTGNSFILQGFTREFNATKYLKLAMNVNEVTASNQSWRLKGFLTVPKASKPVNGELVLKGRNSGEEIVIEEVKLDTMPNNHIYKEQEQKFVAGIDSAILKLLKKDKVYDLYYRLKEYYQYNNARVRISFESQNPLTIKTKGVNYTLYKSNYGNLSLKVENQSDQFKSVLKKIGQALKSKAD
ncbi:glycosyltransferase family 2 protein [Planomicrobium okeanokoites]|uniref:glycosyltransferase family 2 protein n=1 Tax=Planomicrobium okeanokoites TaxID=244 RepID=UPI0024933EA0|nr:glycosyltransferase family 2 protein [Planomicrobium okeanokoites]